MGLLPLPQHTAVDDLIKEQFLPKKIGYRKNKDMNTNVKNYSNLLMGSFALPSPLNSVYEGENTPSGLELKSEYIAGVNI